MTEYIMDTQYDIANGTFSTVKREEIVRCRDCEHYQPWMKGAEPECWANGEPFTVEPDGFCAWAKRRER